MPQARPSRVQPSRRAAAPRVEGVPQRHQAQVDPEGELRVEVGIAGLPGDQAEAGVEQRARQAGARVAPQAAGQQVGEQDAEGGGDDRGDAHAEQVFAEDRLAEGDHPVAGDRLLEVAQAEEVRRHPVAAQQHRLADLRVAGLVGNPQAMVAQWNQVEQAEGDQQQRPGLAAAHGWRTPSQPSRPARRPRTSSASGRLRGSSGSSSPNGRKRMPRRSARRSSSRNAGARSSPRPRRGWCRRCRGQRRSVPG